MYILFNVNFVNVNAIVPCGHHVFIEINQQ